MQTDFDFLVVGAGISGLAAALPLAEAGQSVAVLEAASQPGGVLQTERRDGFLLEHSADSFITDNEEALGWCHYLGLEGQLLPTSAAHRGTYVVCRGRLERVPDGFLLMTPTRWGPILRTPILSLRGKLRLALERFAPTRTDLPANDESLASFVRRRLGNEVFERLVQPLIGGIYTADPERLSLRATLPRFLDMEREHGSLIRAAQKTRVQPHTPGPNSGARYSLFVAPRDGLASLVQAAAARLQGCLRCGVRVTALRRVENRWQATTQTVDGAASILTAAAVVLAVPAFQAADLVAPVDAELAGLLRAIPYADSMIALAGYRREQIGRPLDAFGFVVPDVEQRPIIACSYSSVKFPHRAPSGHELLRIFFGGARHPEQLELSDDQVRAILTQQLGELLEVRGEPVLFHVQRWRRVMPQYHVGHLGRVSRIEHLVRRYPGLELAGNAYQGVGIPHCIRSGQQAAIRAAALLHKRP